MDRVRPTRRKAACPSRRLTILVEHSRSPYATSQQQCEPDCSQLRNYTYAVPRCSLSCNPRLDVRALPSSHRFAAARRSPHCPSGPPRPPYPSGLRAGSTDPPTLPAPRQHRLGSQISPTRRLHHMRMLPRHMRRVQADPRHTPKNALRHTAGTDSQRLCYCSPSAAKPQP